MNYNEIAKTFDEMRVRCRAYYLVYGIGMAAALVIMLMKHTAAALVLFVLMFLLYFLLVRPTVKEYAKKWRETSIRLFTHKHFPEIEYTYAAKESDVPELRKHMLMPMGEKGDQGGLIVRNVTRAAHGDMKVTMMDATIPVGKGVKTVYISGGWLGYTFPTGVEETVRAVKGSLLPDGSYASYLTELGFKPCDMGENMLPNVCVATASGTCSLDKEVVSYLRRLMNVPNAETIVEINADGVYVFMPHRLVNMMPPSLKYKLTEEMIKGVALLQLDESYLMALTLYNQNQQAD